MSTQIEAAQRKIVDRYDHRMVQKLQARFYDNSGFYNFGYWVPDQPTMKDACEALVENIAEGIPEKTGNLLVVACGQGADAKYLTRYYPESAITGINISEQQLGLAQARVPGAKFLKMDATKLDFPDASFDNVICVEAAFHFYSRDDFFRDALRVLKPGGHLVASDIIYRRSKHRDNPTNYVDNPRVFKQRIESIGYTNVVMDDATVPCWDGYIRYMKRWADQEREAGRAGPIVSRLYWLYWMMMRWAGLMAKYYVIYAAQKPLT